MGIWWLAKQPQHQQHGFLLLRLSQHLLPASPFYRFLKGLRPVSSTTLPRPPAEPDHFIVDYLVGSCGLSRTGAVKASKSVAHLKSPERPDAVLRLLKEAGLCSSHIGRLVQNFPRVLAADAKKTLEPKIRALQEAGFSKPELAQLISKNPNAIRHRDAVPKIEFWRKMVGNNEKLLKIATNNRLLGCKVDGAANSNLSFLRSVGMSDADITRIIVRRPRLITSTLNRIMSLVEQVKSLGIPPGSEKFYAALTAVSCLSRATLEAKSKLLRSYGWSEADLLLAIRRYPVILTLSEKKISRAMDFFLNEAGCRPSYIARRAVLLCFSIDKRLIPRYYVLEFLKKKGLPRGDSDLYAAMLRTHRTFVAKYIAQIGENVTEMLETFPKISAMGIAV